MLTEHGLECREFVCPTVVDRTRGGGHCCEGEFVGRCFGKGLMLFTIQVAYYKALQQRSVEINYEEGQRPVKSITIHDLNPTLFITEFEDIKDKDHVKCDGPWSFDKHLILTSDVEGLKQTHQVHLSEALFWVHIHDLPVLVHNSTMGRRIGQALGKVIEVDLEHDDMAWGEYMHIRVCMNVSKPLLRGKKVCVGSSQPIWVTFSYERLPNFCYLCGLLGPLAP